MQDEGYITSNRIWGMLRLYGYKSKTLHNKVRIRCTNSFNVIKILSWVKELKDSSLHLKLFSITVNSKNAPKTYWKICKRSNIAFYLLCNTICNHIYLEFLD